MNRYDGSDLLWSGAEMFDAVDTGDAGDPHVAVDADGDAAAVWRRSDGALTSIWSNRYLGDDGTWGSPELIEFSDRGDAFRPQLAVGANGSMVAVWQQTVDARRSIWASLYR